MGAPTEYYVDPAAGNDTTGNGSIGTPWKSVQKALNTITRNTTSGDRINVKAGTDDVLIASLTLATYGTPSLAAPLIIQGYASAANDGGMGQISGNNGNFAIYAEGGSKPYVVFRDMHLHSTGTASVLLYNIATSRCRIENTAASGVYPSAGGIVEDCWFTDCNYGVNQSPSSVVRGCYFKNGSVRSFAIAINATNFQRIEQCIFSLSGASNGISISGTTCSVFGCSFLSAAGTGAGITSGGGSLPVIQDCIFEGFSGVGGRAIQFYTGDVLSIQRNAYYNNTANTTLGIAWVDGGGNEALPSSGFAKSGSDTYANRLTYFAPVASGSVLTGGLHSGAKGAVPAIGGGTTRPRIYVGGRLRT